MEKLEGENLGQDQVLLKKLGAIVLENLDDEGFSVQTLAYSYGISRSQLHRKLKRIKGQSISQFIREIRLNEAMKMLRNDEASVSEIAYKVGFSSTSYFNTCFHKHYGYSPGKAKHHDYSEEDVLAKAPILPEEKKSLLSRPLLMIIVLAAIFLTIILSLYWAKPANTLPNKPKSIAILPLDHLSDNTSQEYLTAGIHDALIGELGTIKGLRVISRLSTLQYQNRGGLMKDIANELDVDAIIEGSVVIQGDSLRLQLQLIDVYPEEKHLWAEDYHRSTNEILSLQSTVIEDIANSIKISLTKNDKERLISQQNTNPETYKAYLRGMYYISKSNAEDFSKGIEYLHQAVEIDPADPIAYAGLAEGYALLGHGPDPMNSPWHRGKAAALKALVLNPKSAKAHSALAMIQLYYERDWKAAERSFAMAEQLNPNLPYNRYHYAWYLILLGKWEEAIHEHQLAKQLDPLAPLISSDLGMLYYWMGKNDEAIKEVEEALEIDKEFAPAWKTLGDIYISKGWHERGIEAFQRSVEINPASLWALGTAYARIGDRDKALEIAAKLKKGQVSSRNAFGLTAIYALLDENNEAFKWLIHKPSDVYVPWLRVFPGIDSFRKDPRFQEFLDQLNLPPITISAT
ncbi:helix-turn-helix domain-containing protein [Flagellimonas hymeniacidonis]|uniref:Helix-turn-helix domain-containing protein n=1 Tax=Flagellimonas hymeniacidonis TaxID=2603628 RepID=A0A5C8V856_9FLAO|nr:helix-turn-helix domain-containing protein [Flagellimonas hymeniacidonis]TXN38294.1 helix-turn-helix domain-containing protein [Flagellimonas hymeniacidonis]